MRIEGTPEEIIEFVDEVVAYIKNFPKFYGEDVEVKIDGQEIVDSIHTMTQAFRKAMHDSSEEAPSKPQQNNE